MFKSLVRRTSLRTRLVLTLLVLALCALIVSGVVVNRQLEGYLLDRLDRQIAESVPIISSKLLPAAIDRDDINKPDRFPVGSLPVGTYGAAYSDVGQLMTEVQLSYPREASPVGGVSWSVFARPLISGEDLQLASNRGPVFTTVAGDDGAPSFRLLLQSVNGRVLIVGMPLTDIEATLTQLLWLELAVGAVALAILGVLAYVIVRAELRPLERMSSTAGAIAAGDLSHRVDEVAGGSEVGQLGTALNIMLNRIEEAFAARQASEDRLRTFVADASHELRTPLTSIRGYAEMFHRGASTKPQDLDTIMRRIEAESTRMSGLIDDMLLLARLDQKRTLDTSPMHLGPILGEVVQDMSASHPDHRIVLATDDTLWVNADEPSIRQVAVNLIRNACVHTPAATPVSVSVQRAGAYAEIVVADHGPGVPESLRAEVFERFTRADASRGRDAGGTGLGLSIVAAILSAHGGTVTLGETPGGGATFRAFIPLAADRSSQPS
ncbi:MAG: HAMP domain-containing sensor histidine kinase [Candidatus Nanopelagicales bacterium]